MADTRKPGAYAVDYDGLVVLEVVTADAPTVRLRMSPVYASNLGMDLIARSSKVMNADVGRLVKHGG